MQNHRQPQLALRDKTIDVRQTHRAAVERRVRAERSCDMLLQIGWPTTPEPSPMRRPCTISTPENGAAGGRSIAASGGLRTICASVWVCGRATESRTYRTAI